MKALFALPLAIFLCAAAAPPAEVRTGRSVAVEKAPQTYWLSDDLNRLFLQKPGVSAEGAASAGEKQTR